MRVPGSANRRQEETRRAEGVRSKEGREQQAVRDQVRDPRNPGDILCAGGTPPLGVATG
jgi:hypothetical protein